jgi:protein-disulfide isomerase
MSRSRTLSNFANGGILLALAYVLFRPGGAVSEFVAPRLETARQKNAITQSWDRLMTLSSPVYGRRDSDSSKLVVFEFSDYQCRFCREQHDRLSELLGGLDVELRLVHFPLPGHPLALSAAKATACAESQGRLIEMHAQLFETSRDWADSVDWEHHARAVDIADLARFRDCLGSPETTAQIERARQLGRELGVQATPTFVVHKRLVRGALADSVFLSMVGRGRTRP